MSFSQLLLFAVPNVSILGAFVCVLHTAELETRVQQLLQYIDDCHILYQSFSC